MASAKEIPPGGEGKIDITFKTGASGSSGKREKHISVVTNDLEQKNISLTVSADVREKIGITPARINFNQVKKGKEHSRFAQITGDDRDQVKLTGSDSSNPNIKVEINPKGFDDDKYRQIRVILMPTMRTGRLFDKVTIHTDHPEVKDIQVNVIGDITGDITVIPSQLHFGLFQPGKQIDRTITLKSTEDAVFKVLSVKSSIPEVTTSVETIEAGKEYKIHAQLKDIQGDMIKGSLSITTDLKEDGMLDIPIAGRKLPPPGSGNQPGQEVQPSQLPPFLQGNPEVIVPPSKNKAAPESKQPKAPVQPPAEKQSVPAK